MTSLGSDSLSLSSFTRSLANGVALPSLSPLTDKAKFKHTAGAERIAQNLFDSGYDVSWENGSFHVCPSTSLISSATEGTIAAFMQNTPACRRPRTSSVVFSPKSRKVLNSSFDSLQRPATCDSPTQRQGRPSCSAASSPHRHSTDKFDRMAASVDSLPSLRAASPMPDSAPTPEPQQLPWRQLRSASGNAVHLSKSMDSAIRSGTPTPSGAATDSLLRPGTPTWSERRRSGPNLEGRGMAMLKDTSGSRCGSPMPGPATSPHNLRSSSGSPCPSPGPTSRPAKAQHPMNSFTATRGHALMVFNDMDRDKNGKVTRAEFEDAALSLGYNLKQAYLLFDKFDRDKRGYLETNDWGATEMDKSVSKFSKSYMQKFLGLPDITATPEQVKRYWQQQDLRSVKSLTAAINLCRVNAVARASHSANGSGDPVFDTFSFIDADRSGDLSAAELRDAFSVLGVQLSQPVVDQILTTFDLNGDGTVDMHEFTKQMFPKVAAGGRQ